MSDAWIWNVAGKYLLIPTEGKANFRLDFFWRQIDCFCQSMDFIQYAHSEKYER